MKEESIGVVLRLGVIISSLLAILGILATFSAHQFQFLPLHHAHRLLRLSLSFLIAIQVLRVLLTGIIFMQQRAWVFVACSAFIFLGLVVSLYRCF